MRVFLKCDNCGQITTADVSDRSVGGEAACPSCGARHILPEAGSAYERCPVPRCDALFLAAAPAGSCPLCHSLLDVCPNPKCGALNHHGDGWCRRCGEDMAAVPLWPQEGGNQERSGSLLTEMKPGSFLIRSPEWDALLERENEHVIDAPLPAPVAVRGLLVYYNPHREAFEARSTRRDTGSYGQVVWHSEMYRRRTLSYASSPVVHESLLYVVTDHPNYVHRISLSRGDRQVCRIHLNGKAEAEFPGELPPCTPPLLLSLPERVASKTGIAKVLVVLTTEAVCIFDIPSLEHSPEPVLTGRSWSKDDYRQHDWTRPVGVGPFIVATSRTGRVVLCVDMTNYPESVSPEVVPLRKLPPTFEWNSPAVGMNDVQWHAGNTVCWYATDDRHRESKLIKFRPPGFYEALPIPHAGDQYRYLEDCLGPVTDGKAVYVPYFNEGANAMGLTKYKGTGSPVHYSLPPPGVSPLLAAVAEETLVHPGRSSLLAFQMRTQRPAPQECGTYANIGTETTCWCRPIVVGAQVFIQCSDFISCFELNSESMR